MSSCLHCPRCAGGLGSVRKSLVGSGARRGRARERALGSIGQAVLRLVLVAEAGADRLEALVDLGREGVGGAVARLLRHRHALDALVIGAALLELLAAVVAETCVARLAVRRQPR